MSKIQTSARAAAGEAPKGPAALMDAAVKTRDRTRDDGGMRVISDMKENASLVWDLLSGPHKIYHILDRDGDSNVESHKTADKYRRIALCFQIVVTFLMVGTVLAGSLRQYRVSNAALTDRELTTLTPWFELKILCLAVFAADWLVRLLTCPSNIWTFLSRVWNLLDIGTLIPPILSFAGVAPIAVVDVFFILRMLFLVRAAMSVHDFQVVSRTVRDSTGVLFVLMLIAVVTLPMAGSAIYYAERGTFNHTANAWFRECFTPDDCVTEWSPYQNSFDGMWFVYNAMTTLGFGDRTPTSRAGKLIGGVCMVLGIFFLVYAVMVLAVNYEEERRKDESGRSMKEALAGASLRDLQRKHTKLIDDGSLNKFQRPMPVFFYPREDGVPRQVFLVAPDEARYTPLFYLSRNPKTNELVTTETLRSTLRVTLELCLDTPAAQQLAVETMNSYSGPEMPITVLRARFFPVIRLFVRLELPHSNRALLDNVRVVDQVVEVEDLDEMVVPLTLEVLDRTVGVDELRADLQQVLHRCRLNITAWVVYDEPLLYEVPVFCGAVCATSLVREMLASTSGIVFVTAEQIFTLLNGVHQLLDLTPANMHGTSGEPTVVLNVDEVQRDICQAVIQKVASACEDPTQIPDDAFLFGRPMDGDVSTYHGVFVRRLTRDVKAILCDVKVLAVKPKTVTTSLLL